jgi:hypothetical protein
VKALQLTASFLELDVDQAGCDVTDLRNVLMEKKLSVKPLPYSYPFCVVVPVGSAAGGVSGVLAVVVRESLRPVCKGGSSSVYSACLMVDAGAGDELVAKTIRGVDRRVSVCGDGSSSTRVTIDISGCGSCAACVDVPSLDSPVVYVCAMTASQLVSSVVKLGISAGRCIDAHQDAQNVLTAVHVLRCRPSHRWTSACRMSVCCVDASSLRADAVPIPEAFRGPVKESVDPQASELTREYCRRSEVCEALRGLCNIMLANNRYVKYLRTCDLKRRAAVSEKLCTVLGAECGADLDKLLCVRERQAPARAAVRDRPSAKRAKRLIDSSSAAAKSPSVRRLDVFLEGNVASSPKKAHAGQGEPHNSGDAGVAAETEGENASNDAEDLDTGEQGYDSEIVEDPEEGDGDSSSGDAWGQGGVRGDAGDAEHNDDDDDDDYDDDDNASQTIDV